MPSIYRKEAIMSDPVQEEIRKNYEAFIAKLPDLLKEQAEKFALMRNG